MSDGWCIAVAKANYRNAKEMYERTGWSYYKSIMDEFRSFLEAVDVDLKEGGE